MEPRNALIAALLMLGLAGCGDTTNEPDMSVVTDMGLPSNDIGHLGCSLTIDISPQNAIRGDTLVANVVGLPATPTNVQWYVQHAGDPEVKLTGTSSVSYKADATGTYTFFFQGDIDTKTCSAQGSRDVVNGNGARVSYLVRALPPESYNLVLTDQLYTLVGGTSASDWNVQLSAGMALSGVLSGPGGVGVAGEVRLIASEGPDAVGTASTTGGFTLAVRPDGVYQPLLIPQAPQSMTLAPHLGMSATGARLAIGTFVVGTGEAVSGSVVDNGGIGIANAHVVLRAGALPSGLGVTVATTGMFTLRAEQQTYALTVGADDWPIATVGGVVVPAGGVSIGVAYTIGRVAVGGTVTRADGTTPVAGARVTITSRDTSCARW
jgi:hypothetical protein